MGAERPLYGRCRLRRLGLRPSTPYLPSTQPPHDPTTILGVYPVPGLPESYPLDPSLYTCIGPEVVAGSRLASLGGDTDHTPAQVTDLKKFFFWGASSRTGTRQVSTSRVLSNGGVPGLRAHDRLGTTWVEQKLPMNPIVSRLREF